MKYVIGFVVGLLIATILVYFFVCEKPTAATILHAGDEISGFEPVVWGPESREWLEEEKREVRAIIAQMEIKLVAASMRGKLDKSGTKDIQSAFGRNGTFIGHDGETYYGGKRIREYFNKIVSDPNRSLTDIQFELEVVYAEEFFWNRDDSGDDDPRHPIYFVISCSYSLDGVRYDPPGTTHCIHIRSCDCEI